jgi:hypothetical protein
MLQESLLRARRAALGQVIAAGGIPSVWQFRRAGLPPLVAASDLLRQVQEQNSEVAAKVARHSRRSPGPAF